VLAIDQARRLNKIRVRVEIMGPGKYESVRKSQSVLIMVDPMIFTRTRTCAVVQGEVSRALRRWGEERSRAESELTRRTESLQYGAHGPAGGIGRPPRPSSAAARVRMSGGGGEPFLRVHWVAVPEALGARRVNRRRRQRRRLREPLELRDWGVSVAGVVHDGGVGRRRRRLQRPVRGRGGGGAGEGAHSTDKPRTRNSQLTAATHALTPLAAQGTPRRAACPTDKKRPAQLTRSAPPN
jgi:hypothetical protein